MNLPPRPPLRVFYSPAYVVESGLETVTKARYLARLLEDGEGGDVVVSAPQWATREELLAVHSGNYVWDFLSGRGGPLACGPWSKELLGSVLASTGGMRDATLEALREGRSGSLSSGLHHARRGAGTGFCAVNGLALAALVALGQVDAVGILDLDAHFGGGTAQILRGHPGVRLADVSVRQFDRWKPRPGEPHFVERVTEPGRYLEAVRRSTEALEGVGLLIYNAGMDVHEHAGGLRGITTGHICERERWVADWARSRGIPLVFALAGGYQWGGLSLEGIARLHLETVRAIA